MSPWLDEGHEWLGKRACRIFDGQPSEGHISLWQPSGPDEDDVALWHMKHDDGDSEDLEEDEVMSALQEHATQHCSAYSTPLKRKAPPPSKGARRQK